LSLPEVPMKKLLLLLITLIFLAVSCHSSKKAENDADILPDEDEEATTDDDVTDADEIGDEDEDFVLLNPCLNNPCDKIENSNGKCTATGIGSYSCGCVENYFWDGEKCVDPCEDVSCGQLAHASGECKPKDAFSFSCDCDAGYFWGYLGCKKIAFPNICTGWKTCYNNEEKINCPKPGEPFYGQDAQYAELGYCIEHNFSKEVYHKNDDAVIDLNPERIAVDDLLHLEWTYEYIDTGANTWEEAVKYCEDFEYAERTDWRLASLKELMLSNILDTDYDEFWSSDEYAGDDSKAWTGSANGRWWSVKSKTSFHRDARCVHGKPIDTTVSFDTLGKLNELVAFDYENGLAWQLYAGRSDTFGDALEYCENSSYSGFSDWRVPNAHELASIVNLKKTSPATDLPLRDLSMTFSWTSTNQYYRTSGINLNTGEIHAIDKDKRADILCVRNEPCKRGWFWDGKKCVKSPCTEELCKNQENSNGICYLNDFESHSCGCVENYFWNGEKCTSPCAPNPCKNDTNSTGECTTISINMHECGCIDGYFWDGEKCLENPCNGVSCSQFEHGSGECRPADAFNYSCGCVEGYWWWGKDKGCINKKPAAVNTCSGQNKCYDNEKEIVCPAENEDFFGQDAQYARLGYCIPQNFSIDKSVANEPVVVDNNLGLMWQQKIPPVEEQYAEDALAYCEDLVYGGYDDWRMPTAEDFMTIADYGRYDPALNTGYFPESGPFWTSSMIHSFGTDWVFGPWDDDYFTIFDVTKPSAYRKMTRTRDCYSDKTTYYAFSFNIRCVRNKIFDSEYYFLPDTFGENAMLSDNTMIVMRKENAKYTWSEALEYCQNLDYAGISDWRLPNIKELVLSAGIRFGESSRARSSTTEIFSQDFDFPRSDYYGSSSSYTKKEKVESSIFCIANNPCGEEKFWNGEKCVKNPCDPNPCESEEGLNKTCKVIDEETYFCGCGKCMYDVEHSNGKCYENTMNAFYCGCEEGYRWINWDTYYGCYEN